MSVYTKRVQAVLSEEQFAILSALSSETGKPLSLLIREAVEKVYFEQAARKQRKAALMRLLSLQAPVSDWPQMENEIARGAVHD